MDDINGKWENKALVVCNKCRQNLRIPISYNPLHVTCPKCRNEVQYSYISEFGNQCEQHTKVQLDWILLILGMIMIYSVSFIIFLAGLLSNGFRGGLLFPFAFGIIACILIGIFILPKLIDYKTFSKYLPIELLVINRQGIIYFDKEFRAKECLNWNEIKSVKLIYARHMFAGLIETKREPACIELDVGGKGKVLVPPAMFFSKEQRMEIIGELSRHYQFTNPVYGKQ